MAAKAREIDWTAIELDYRAGVKTLRAIGKEFGVSNPAIVKRAKRDGWPRDLSAKIRQRTAEKVSKAAVSKEVSKQNAANERQVVEAYSDKQTTATLRHQAVLDELVDTLAEQLAELRLLNKGELRKALETVLAEETEVMSAQGKAALRKAFYAAIGIGGRTAAGRQVAAAIDVAIDKQRQALGMDEQATPENALIAALKEIRGIK